MKAIDTPALIQRIQEARARLGVTIRECAEKIGQPPYSAKIHPDDWARIERGQVPAQPEFCAQAAAMLGFEVPFIDAQHAPGKSYRCATLSDEDSAELDRLADQVSDFCKAKGLGLLMLTTSNMTRSTIEDGHSEESRNTLHTTNLHALPSTMAPLAHMLVALAKEPQQVDIKESLRQLAGYSLAHKEHLKETFELAPAGDSILEGFHDSRPRFKAQ